MQGWSRGKAIERCVRVLLVREVSIYNLYPWTRFLDWSFYNFSYYFLEYDLDEGSCIGCRGNVFTGSYLAMEVFFNSLVGGGVQLGPLATAATDWSIVACPGWLWWWRIWWNEDWQGKPKYSEKTRPSVTMSTTKPTWPYPGSNAGRRGGKPATNRLSYGAAMEGFTFQTIQVFIRHVTIQCSWELIHLDLVFKWQQEATLYTRRGTPYFFLKYLLNLMVRNNGHGCVLSLAVSDFVKRTQLS
jgi:hypothetical protein